MADLNALTAFAAVARLRSFRKAALERGVSASALSHALRALEERLGVRLLNRTTRSVTPTEAGQMLLARLAPAMREIDDALLDLSTLQDVPAGKLRLNVPRPAARLLLAPMLASFVARYPRVQVDVVTDDGMIDIVRDGFDAGIRFGEQVAAEMIAVPVGAPQPFVVVGSPAYLAARLAGACLHGPAFSQRASVCVGVRAGGGCRQHRRGRPAGVRRRCTDAARGARLAYVYEADARAFVDMLRAPAI